MSIVLLLLFFFVLVAVVVVGGVVVVFVFVVVVVVVVVVEVVVVVKVVVYKDEYGNYKYAGVRMWAAWMGLNANLWKFWACDLHVLVPMFPLVGEDKKGLLQDTQADCGSIVYCEKCSIILEALGRAWHACSAESVAAAHLLETELRQRVSAIATAWPHYEEVHVCDNSCTAHQHSMLTRGAQRNVNTKFMRVAENPA